MQIGPIYLQLTVLYYDYDGPTSELYFSNSTAMVRCKQMKNIGSRNRSDGSICALSAI